MPAIEQLARHPEVAVGSSKKTFTEIEAVGGYVDENKNNYEVGYRKPPQRTRFQQGRSGNPKGRPRGSRSSATLLREILSERVEVRENGRIRTLTKKELILRYAVNKAATGDSRAREFLINRTPWLQKEFAEPKRSHMSEIEAFERAREILRGAL